MAFYKKHNRNQTQEKWTQTVFSNIAETPTNYTKKYYAIIETEGTDKVYNYECVYRNEAREYFEEEARLDHGKFKYMGVYK